MRPEGVVVEPPGLDQDLSFGRGVEDFPVQVLVTHRAVEAIALAILTWAARYDVERLHADLCQPFLNSAGDDSGPLSDRICAGGPRVKSSSASAASTASPLSRRATGKARHPTGFINDQQDAELSIALVPTFHKVMRPHVSRTLSPMLDT